MRILIKRYSYCTLSTFVEQCNKVLNLDVSFELLDVKYFVDGIIYL